MNRLSHYSLLHLWMSETEILNAPGHGWFGWNLYRDVLDMTFRDIEKDIEHLRLQCETCSQNVMTRPSLVYLFWIVLLNVPCTPCHMLKLKTSKRKKNSVLQSDNGKNMLESFATFNCSVTSCKRQDVSNRGHKTHCCIDPHHQLQWCQRASISLYNVLHPAGPSDISPLPQLFPC